MDRGVHIAIMELSSTDDLICDAVYDMVDEQLFWLTGYMNDSARQQTGWISQAWYSKGKRTKEGMRILASQLG